MWKLSPVGSIVDPKGSSETMSALTNSAITSFKKDPAEFLGEVEGTVAMAVVPVGGEVGAASDGVRGVELLGDVSDASRGTKVVTDLSQAADGGKAATDGLSAAQEAAATRMASKAIAGTDSFLNKAYDGLATFLDNGLGSTRLDLSKEAREALGLDTPKEPMAPVAPNTQGPVVPNEGAGLPKEAKAPEGTKPPDSTKVPDSPKAPHESLSKIAHTALDLIGAVPVVGTVPSLVSAAWSAAELDWADAAYSLFGVAASNGPAIDGKD
jgi:hypothetical protein